MQRLTRNASGNAVFGVFHHRVVVIDEAGNRAQSGDSSPLQLMLL